jgi:hypothetical protein
MVPPVGKHPYSLIRDDLRIPPVVLFVAARLYLKSVTGRTRAPTRGTRPSVRRKNLQEGSATCMRKRRMNSPGLGVRNNALWMRSGTGWEVHIGVSVNRRPTMRSQDDRMLSTRCIAPTTTLVL